jgi:hypothetical protein
MTGDLDIAVVGHEQTRQQLEQRTLACAVGPKQCYELAVLNREREIIQRLELAIGLARSVYYQGVVAHNDSLSRALAEPDSSRPESNCG